MKHSLRLKQAKGEILEILSKYDIAGVVALHRPGVGEGFYRIETGYSCAKIVGDGAVSIRTRLDQDYGGDKDKRDQAIGDTANMFKVLEGVLGPLVLSIMNINDDLKKAAPNIEHGESAYTPTQETDN